MRPLQIISGFLLKVGYLFLLLSFIPIFLLCLPLLILAKFFDRPIDRSATEVANFLRNYIDGTGGDWDWDDFVSISIADPSLERIRKRLLDVDHPENADRLTALKELLADADQLAQRAADETQFLIRSLKRVTEGGEISRQELSAGISDAPLGRTAQDALHELNHWVSDADTRERDHDYAVAQRGRLKSLLARLEEEHLSG